MQIDLLHFVISLLDVSREPFEKKIDEFLRNTMTYYRADSAYIFLFSNDYMVMEMAYEVCKEESVPKRLQSQQMLSFLYPWWTERITNNCTFFIEKLEVLPAEASEYIRWLALSKTSSVLNIPISNEDKVIGFLGVEWRSEKKLNIQSQYFQYVSTLLYKIFVTQEKQNNYNERIREQNLLLDYTEVQMWYFKNVLVLGKVNEAFAKFYGKNKKEMTHKSIFDLLDYDIAEQMSCNNAIVFEKKEVHIVEFKTRDCQGKEKILYVVMRPIINESNEVEHVICTGQDITEMKKVEEALIKAKETAEQANAAKSMFLANMSHEIRTPINGIMGFLNLLKQTALDDIQREYVAESLKSSKVLLDIINDILDFSKIEAGKLEIEYGTVNIFNIMEDIKSMFSFQCQQKGIDLQLQVEDSCNAFVKADGTRIKQVLMNLVSNAVKFTVQGYVKIEVACLNESNKSIVFNFKVIDTGIGISKQDKNKLFKNFSQIDQSATKKYSGTGLGLAISQRLVSMMGGEIQVNSIKNKTTTFSFELKLNKAKVEKSIHIIDKKAAVNKIKSHIKVLVAEDNKSNQKLMEFILKKLKVTFDIAQNGEEAVKMYDNDSYHIIFMDCQMPVLNGFDATKQIRSIEEKKDQKPVPIIALTANALKGDEEKCRSYGMDDYISKPFKLSLIEDAIKKWI